VDLGERAAREASVQERVHLRETGRERTQASILSPQRRGVVLEPTLPQEALEGALAIARGRGVEIGEGDGAH